MARLIASVEALQDRFALALGDARPVIGNSQLRALRVIRQFDTHLPAVGRELDRVVEQIAERLEQQRAVAVHRRHLIDSHRPANSPVRGGRCISVGAFMNQGRETHRRKPAAPFQCTNLRNTEHRTETIEQHIGFDSRALDHWRDTVVLDDVHAFGDVRQQGADMRGRRTQVVRDTVACALDFRHQPFYFLEHVIHQMREHIELVAPAYGQAPVKLALGDAQGDVADVAHSPHLPEIKQQATGYAHEQAEQTAANERIDHRLANMQDMREIAGDHDLFAAVATYSHRPYDWRPDVMGHNQGTVERVARAVERQIRGYRHDIAGDVFAVGVEQAEVISMQVFAFRAPV